MRKSVGLVFALALLLGACGGSEEGDATGEPTTTSPQTTAASSDSGETEASITIANFAFSGPATVEAGTTVTVTNEDTFGHTWTAEGGAWDSGTLAQGDSFEFTFDEPGEYSYFCTIHPAQMTGTITVEG